MTLTLAGRVVLVLVVLALLLFLIGVAARVWAGQWEAERVIAVGIATFMIAFLTLLWRWE